MFTDSVFLGPDSLSPKAIQKGIELAENKYDDYPEWLPWVFSGLPSIHSFQNISHLYMPYNFFKILIDIGVPRFFEFFIHYIFLGIGMVLLLRQLGVSKLGSLFGSASYMLMPYLITMIVHGHGSQLMTTAYIPWIIWSLIKVRNTPNLINYIIFAILVGFQLQRSHVQVAYYTWMMVGLYICFEVYFEYKNKIRSFNFLKYVISGLFTGILLSLSIYLPALNYTNFSTRGSSSGGVGLEYATQWSFSLSETMTFFIPSFYGFGGATYWGNMPFTDYPNYMGIIVLILSIIGMLKYKNNFKLFLLMSLILALLISFGKNFNVVYNFFYSYIPLFNKFRVPVMILIIFQFSICIFAAYGFDILLRSNNQNKCSASKLIYFIITSLIIFCLWIKVTFKSIVISSVERYPQLNKLRIELVNEDIFCIIILLILMALFTYLYNSRWLNKNSFGVLVILLSLIDIYNIDNKIISPSLQSYRHNLIQPMAKLKSHLKEDDIIKFLKSDTVKYRILPIGELSRSNRWSAFGIESISGYHPAKLSSYSNLMEQVGWANIGLLRMLNVKYIISLENFSHPNFKLVHSGLLFNNGQYNESYIYEFNQFLPRFYFAEELHKSNENTILNDIFINEFTPEIHSRIKQQPPDFKYSDSSLVKLISWSPDKISFQTITNSKQFLIISEMYYPSGWKMGNSANIYEVNNIIRGIVIEPGNNIHTMIFDPLDYKYGKIISNLTLLILIILSFILYYNNRNEA